MFGAAIFGIVAARFGGVPFFVWKAIAVVAIIGWGICFLKRFPFRSTVFLLLAIAAGFGCRHHLRWNLFPSNDIGFYAQEKAGPVCVRGTVIEMPRLLPAPPEDPTRPIAQRERTLFTLHTDSLRDGDRFISVTGKLSVSVEGNRDDLRYGDRVELFGGLSKPNPPQNPGDPDYATSLRNRRILAILRVPSPGSVRRLVPGKPSAGRILETVRRAGHANIERCMTPSNAAVATAMILGLREGIDEETTQTLQETGTLHILAISGLHIGLVAAAALFLLRLFGTSRRRSAVILVGTVIGYLFLTDVQPPAIRATVLVCVVAASMLSFRSTFAVNTLCATALIVLLLNPSELFQFGAQLSFIATGAFLWIPRLPTRIFVTPDGREQNEDVSTGSFAGRCVRLVEKTVLGITALLLVSTIIWFVSMPLILERIHLFTPIAILVNPLLWFPLAAALSFGFAVMVFGAVPFIGSVLGWFADQSFDILFNMIGYFHELGGHYWLPGPPIWWNVVFYGFFVLWTFFPFSKQKPRLLAGLLASWLIVGVVAVYGGILERQWNDRLTVSISSVGHGSGILIVTPENRAVVFDAGCFSSPKRCGDILSRSLWRAGKTSIDAIVLSHADSDHYNGVLILAERFRIDAVLVSPYMFEKEDGGLDLLRQKLSEKNIPLKEIGDGDDLSAFGLFDSKILHPPKEGFDERAVSNACSVVLTFRHEKIRVLFPGDLDGKTTAPFLERSPMHCDVVMIPHHGGKSRLTEPLLQWTTPKDLVVSGGQFSRNDALLDDLRRRGFSLHNTFDDGAVELSVDRNGATWKHYRSPPSR